MKVQFEDNSYVEIRRSETPGKIIITVAAKDKDNPRKRTINAVEISEEEYKNLVNI